MVNAVLFGIEYDKAQAEGDLTHGQHETVSIRMPAKCNHTETQDFKF